MSKIYFTTEEVCIVDSPIPQDIATRLWMFHILPMSRVRERYGAPIYASERSVYRPRAYEISKGRSGDSQHTFLGDLTKGEGKGAGDWTGHNIDRLLRLIIEETDYLRIAFYPDKKFLHCDYKPTSGNKRQYFETDENGIWQFKHHVS